MLRGIALTSAVYAAGSFASKFSKLLLIPILVRYLTPEEVGLVVYLEALMLACGRFFPMGLGLAVRRFYGEIPDQAVADAYSRMIWLVTIGLGLAGFLVFGALVSAFPRAISAHVSSGLLVLTLAAGALRCAQAVPMQRFIARGEAKQHCAVEFLEMASTVAVIICLVVVAGWGVQGYLWGSIVSAAAWMFVYWLMLAPGSGGGIEFSRLGPSLKYSLPLWPHLLFTWAITFADRLVLERLVPLSEVGIYGIGYQLASVVPVVTFAVINAWLPGYFRSGDSHAGRLDYLRVLSVFTTLVALMVLAIYVMAPEVVRWVTAPGFEGSTRILQIVAIGVAYHAVFQAMILVLFYEKAGSQISIGTGLSLGVNLLGLAILVPKFGIIGAAWATVLAFASATVYSLIRAWKLLKVPMTAVCWSIAPVIVGTAMLSVLGVVDTQARAWSGRVSVAVVAGTVIMVTMLIAGKQLPGRGLVSR
jgi:O-antigen/teichoic acid export membrane protein